MTDQRHRSRRGVETGLRTAAVWATVATLAEQRRRELARPLRVLDLGGGTGGLAVPLAKAGHEVIVVDPSPDALAALRRRSAEEGVEESLRSTQGDADDLRAILKARVDLVCVHGTLEVVDDPPATLRKVAEVVVPGGHLSVVSAQRLAAVLARVLAGHLGQAKALLTSPDGRWGESDPLPRRFDQTQVEHLVMTAGFDLVHSQGISLFADLAPSAALDSDADRAALLDLERVVTSRPEFAALQQIGSGVHVVGRRH